MNPGPRGSDGCGGVTIASGSARLVNSIASRNTGNPPNVAGTFLLFGHNLIGVDPMVGPLANNGGPTLTMALLPGSPAIDAADPAAAPATDQRGVPRPVGPAPDIGAFEYGWPAVLHVTQSGGAGLDLSAVGNAGQTCRLLLSTDFSNWAPVATNQIGADGTTIFHENCAAGMACRFYRLVMP